MALSRTKGHASAPAVDGERRFQSGTMRRCPLVLLVDDDTEGRELLGTFLGSVGFEIMHAENGARAISLATSRKPDLVVMDLEMPVMGGREAVERLHEDSRTASIPVVILSGADHVDAPALLRAGCSAYLVKPCNPIDLEGVARSLVELASGDVDDAIGG